ncbi:dihydroneopterin aldolase [Phyllobacterium sp. 0TCS1.6C]|uniref:amino acid kinase family protein n=1 Tax=unclassified Phyllobacterium TaxID=2638441 RepID=UPI002263F32C|nr:MULTISPECIES: dihydroneopterin aldolase [unclassified Phyllobacterium]MCX8280192.1 dihydroneopterin aldolase [Phyllobacterium sp. 0TCS1.6C]MCX8294247.1 dihydroneopterin aldolase [Phyllobacterium sp. 0TCS1.6A]
MTPLVAKLGGSTVGHGEMQLWLNAFVTATFPIIVVPGGGPFADQVRSSQTKLGYSDAAAHEMAILAMDQLGIAMAERHERMQPVRTLDDMRQTLRRGLVPVWLPSLMAIGRGDIPVGWDVTSDSLSAWLAREIGATGLLLVKQTDEYDTFDRVDALAAAGIVDNMLPRMLDPSITLHIAGPALARSLTLPLATAPGRVMIHDRQAETAEAP